jgi:hypothetical protein
MGARHLSRVLAEPAPVIRPLAGPLEVGRGPPMSSADCAATSQNMTHFVQAGLLGRWRSPHQLPLPLGTMSDKLTTIL